MQKKYFSSLVLFSLLLLLLCSYTLTAQNKEPETIRLKIIGMSDLHGNFLPYNFLERRPATAGLPYIYSFVRQERKDTSQHVVVLNSGDILQGSMSVYYYNYVDPRDTYMPFVFLNKVGVDASVMGNHDLDPGMFIIRRAQTFGIALNSELLAANVVFRGTQRRVLKPYTILEKGGLRIAVLGLTTPILTQCAKTTVLDGLDILDMLEPARYWMNHIQTREAPDLVIGLFHAGFMDITPDTKECLLINNPAYIAKNVPGFDGFILGHQHKNILERIYINDRPVWFVEPGFGGSHVGVIDFEVQKIPGERAKILNSSARLENVSETQVLTQDILDDFRDEMDIIKDVANEVVTVLKDTANCVDALFGSSFFVDITHKVQLKHTGADVSFASLLGVNVLIPPGPLTFSDLLRFYRFENKLVTLNMSGKEIKDYLEYSYNLWTHEMSSPNDMFLTMIPENQRGSFVFKVPVYNFDSGTGLDYVVDVTKPAGKRVTILRMWSERPFHEDSIYKVAVNSYRFSGAGGHFELGAKIKPEELANRSVRTYDIQVRELIRRELVQRDNTDMSLCNLYNNWRFIPDNYVHPAKNRETAELNQILGRAPKLTNTAK
jgi:2',3'-cyclic-nucleotide 2'-phosphodiesterase/3'-nucleotidase